MPVHYTGCSGLVHCRRSGVLWGFEAPVHENGRGHIALGPYSAAGCARVSYLRLPLRVALGTTLVVEVAGLDWWRGLRRAWDRWWGARSRSILAWAGLAVGGFCGGCRRRGRGLDGRGGCLCGGSLGGRGLGDRRLARGRLACGGLLHGRRCGLINGQRRPRVRLALLPWWALPLRSGRLRSRGCGRGMSGRRL